MSTCLFDAFVESRACAHVFDITGQPNPFGRYAVGKQWKDALGRFCSRQSNCHQLPAAVRRARRWLEKFGEIEVRVDLTKSEPAK